MRFLNLAWPLLALGAQALSTELQSQQVSVSLHRQPVAAPGVMRAPSSKFNSRLLAQSIRGGVLKGWSDTEDESSSSEDTEEDSEVESDSTEHSDDKFSKDKKKGATSNKSVTVINVFVLCTSLLVLNSRVRAYGCTKCEAAGGSTEASTNSSFDSAAT
eukprot:18869-Heterococcus_DN1.PRE.1